MGTWSRNFLFPKHEPAKVHERFVTWLERKGFDLRGRPSVFETDSEEERSAFLVSNAEWTVLIYSEAFPEGDRLLSVFEDFETVVEVWIGDSDDWGYALFQGGKWRAGASLSEDHASVSSDPPASAADAEMLCVALGKPEQAAAIRRVQKKRRLFADVPCQEFCDIIGAIPATLTCGDFEGWNAGRLEARTVAGWRVEPLMFERRKPLGEVGSAPLLHGLAIRSFAPKPAQEQFDPELARQFQRKAQLLVWLFRPIGWLLAAPFLAGMWLQKHGLKKSANRPPQHALLSALSALTPPWRREGEWLVNDRHRCRVRLSEPKTSDSEPLFLTGIFHLRVSGTELACHAVRPASIRNIFDLRSDQTAVQDEKFVLNGLSARYLLIRSQQQNTLEFRYFWFAETDTVVYQFTAYSRSELPEGTVSAMRKVVDSFRLHPT